jgi:hypothetical protein
MPWSRRLSMLLPSAALLTAVVLAAASFGPFGPVKSYMDSLTADGNAETFTPELFASFVAIARLAAAALAGTGAALFRFRSVTAQALSRGAHDVACFLGDLSRDGVRAMRSEPPAHLCVLAAIILAGIAVRALALAQPVNYDEAFTYITYASRPWPIAWADYSYPNNHLFHTFLAHVALRLFGFHLWALRLPAFVAGCLAIPLSYAVARRLADPSAALLTAALMASTPSLIAFSVLARGYTLMLAIFLLMLVCADDILTARSPRAWIVMTVLATLGFFTVPVFIYPYGAVLVWLLIAPGDRDARRVPVVIRSAATTFVLTAVLYAPALATSGLASGFDYATGSAAGTFVGRLLPSLAEIASDLTRGMPLVLAGVLGLACAAGLVALRGSRALYLPVALLSWAIVAILAQRVVAPARVWLFVLPVSFVVASAGAVRPLARLGGLAVGSVLAVILCANALWHRPALYTEVNGKEEVYGNTDLEQVALYLKQALRSQDAVISAIPLDYPLEFYLRVHDVPTAFLRRPGPDPARLLVVANDRLGETVPVVLAKKGFAPARVASSQLIRAFEYSSVYDVRMRP